MTTNETELSTGAGALDAATPASIESTQPETTTTSSEPLSGETRVATPESTRLTPEKIAEFAKGKKKSDAKSVEAAPKPVTQETTTTTTTTPVFTPNFKFKYVSADGAKHEEDLPELIRPIIKDAESEKMVRDIFEKAKGLDYFKDKHEKLSTKHATVERNLNDVVGAIQELRELYQGGDLDAFFDRLKIPTERVLQYALDKVTYSELPPEQRQVLDSRLAAQRRARELERQNQNFAQQNLSAATHVKGVQLDSCLARPDIQAVAQAFESAPGRKLGDFRKAVCEHGEYVWFKSNGQQDLSPEEAIQQVIARFGVQIPTSANSGVPPAPQASQPTQVSATTPQSSGTQTPAPQPHRPNVPVIPNVAGRSVSPTKQQPRSIDDLRKLAKTIEG